ncbi:MAG: hypothetical protein QXI39_04155 [Candidatus Bathyarchaeia archaeon]
MSIDVFPTGICGCGQRQSENVVLFNLMREVKRDFEGKVELNIMDYGTHIDEALLRLNQILEASGKGRLIELGLGAQLFRSLIPLIAINGKIAFAASVPSKEALYAKIKEAIGP